MNKWNRRWLHAFDNGIDDKVVLFLQRLKVINHAGAMEFMHSSSRVYSQLIDQLRKEEARQANAQREKQRQSKPARQIKPTKVR